MVTIKTWRRLPTVVGIIALASQVQVQAQAAAPAPASASGPAGLGGPVVPGVCFISREALLTNSKVAIYAAERIKQITAEAQAEIDAQRKPIDDEIAALRAQASKLTAEQIRAQEQAINTKLAPIQAKADLRKREIEKTRTDAVAAISAQAQPVIAAVYAQKGCGVLFDRNAVLGGNYTNDLTPGVVAALDAKVTTLTIQRATLDAPRK